MVFLDLWYLVFTLFGLLAVWGAPKSWKPNVLLFLCLLFHWHYARPGGLVPVLLLAFAVYAALRAGKMLAAAVGVCVAAWFFYRQPAVQGILGFSQAFAAPLALSVFTIGWLHLLMDRAAGRLRQVPSLRDYFLFLLFFPALGGGPIRRIQEFQPQAENLGWPGAEQAARALVRIMAGFFLKLVVSSWFRSLLPLDLHTDSYASTLLLGFYAYVFIVMDLTAYSHIAIGSARLLGVVLPENVNFIFLARSFSDFWKRCLMPLTRWFRDYLLSRLVGPGAAEWRYYLAAGLALYFAAFWDGSGLNILLWVAINVAGVFLESTLSRARAWKDFSSGSAAKAIPWIQWALFQPCQFVLSLLLLYPLNQVLAQLARGP